MIKTEVLIVGGGPAGSACAWHLKQHGVDCLILDQHEFPRFKPCAGWITPELIRDLEMDPEEYPHSFTTFRSFEVSIRGFKFRLPTRQHAIRRYEFDNWLLQRSGAALDTQRVKTITQTGDGYVIDGTYSGKYLVGAGGTHCPVYRTLFQPSHPKESGSLVVAQEEEFPYHYTDSRCHLWFLENGLPGYAWYVPKADGYVNVGLGGFAERLKVNGDTLKKHWERLIQRLDAMGLVRGHAFKPSGHSYYVRRRISGIRNRNAFLVGDAARLATLDMGEGIRPAVQSGLLAAESIIYNRDYSLASIPKYSWPSILRPRI
jgi:flavin-dependent dehydrogenase